MYISVLGKPGQIKRMKGTNQEFEVTWNQVQLFKITGEKI